MRGSDRTVLGTNPSPVSQQRLPVQITFRLRTKEQELAVGAGLQQREQPAPWPSSRWEPSEKGNGEVPRITGSGWSSREEGPDCAYGPSWKALAGVQAGDRERIRTGVRVVKMPGHIHRSEVDSAWRVIKQQGPKKTQGRWTELLPWAGPALPCEGAVMGS